MGDNSEERLVCGLKNGDAQAWPRLVETYGQPLLAFVRGQLPPAIRRKVDEEDVVQVVFRSVFVRVHQGTFDCDSDERLWDILCIRATKRLRGEIRRHRRGKRDVRHEDGMIMRCVDEDYGAREPVDPHAGPERLAAIRDELLAFVDRLDLRSQVLVYLRLDNYTLKDIADLTKWSLRTVMRLWKGVRRRCQELDQSNAR